MQGEGQEARLSKSEEESADARGASEDKPWPDVPIDMEPCEMRKWMDERLYWALSLPMDMAPEDIQALYRRHVDSPCPVDGILSEIGAHPNTPTEILTELAQPRWRDVHLGLATNPSLPVDVLRRLAKSRRSDVLEHVAWNRKTPADVLEKLARQTKAKEAQAAAMKRLGWSDK